MWVFGSLPFAVGIVSIYLEDASGVKDERALLEIYLLGAEAKAYLVMKKMLISPTTISMTPSSQPTFVLLAMYVEHENK